MDWIISKKWKHCRHVHHKVLRAVICFSAGPLAEIVDVFILQQLIKPLLCEVERVCAVVHHDHWQSLAQWSFSASTFRQCPLRDWDYRPGGFKTRLGEDEATKHRQGIGIHVKLALRFRNSEREATRVAVPPQARRWHLQSLTRATTVQTGYLRQNEFKIALYYIYIWYIMWSNMPFNSEVSGVKLRDKINIKHLCTTSEFFVLVPRAILKPKDNNIKWLQSSLKVLMTDNEMLRWGMHPYITTIQNWTRIVDDHHRRSLVRLR